MLIWNSNYSLGLSAIAGPFDVHLGPFIIAMESLRESLVEDSKQKHEIDLGIRKFALSQGLILPAGEDGIPPEAARKLIVSELEKTCGSLHFIGHDLITGVYALAAIEKVASAIPASIVSGICNTIKSFGNAPPGIFHGCDAGEFRRLEKDAGLNALLEPSDLVQMTTTVLDEVGDTHLGYGFRAQEYHAITHTHALIWLHRNEAIHLYRLALKPWCVKMKVLERIMHAKDSNLRRAPYEPIEIGSPAFWKRVDGFSGDQHLYKATLALLDLSDWGYITREDVHSMVKRKFGYLFSRHNGEFNGPQPF